MENHRFCLPTPQYLTYRSITHFSIETAGHFDLDAELKKWVSGSPTPIERKFNKSLNIYRKRLIRRWIESGYKP
ncbi:PH domain-containing protein [Anaerosporomusa subterranea]|jgi:hypothetical protein|uniref:PH domain-containing protein n=1 Tax=Anaerosporomusa subterranea TaxID=1794912 RepID=UPI0009EE8E9D